MPNVRTPPSQDNTKAQQGEDESKATTTASTQPRDRIEPNELPLLKSDMQRHASRQCPTSPQDRKPVRVRNSSSASSSFGTHPAGFRASNDHVSRVEGINRLTAR